MPQSLMYNFGKQIDLSEISYLPRQTSDQDIASKFNIYTAENAGDPYTLSLSGGTFIATQKTAQFTPIASSDRIVDVAMEDGRGRVGLPAGASYTLDPHSRVLRDLPHIAEFQRDTADRAKAAAERARVEAAKKP